MVNVVDLYDYAERQGYDVDWFSMSTSSSLSVMLPDGHCCIAIDPWKMDTLAKERVRLAHELGHCEEGAFYNPFAAYDLRQKHEHRADKWAIKKLVPKDELDAAVKAGYTEVWQLADYFGVDDDFIRKAVCWYEYGNMDSYHTIIHRRG